MKNDKHVDQTLNIPSIKLGPRTSNSLLRDPKHLAFVLSRYKFCAKMLQGKKAVLEVGCGDAFGAPIAAQAVERLVCIDRIPDLIEGNRSRLEKIKNIEFKVFDITRGKPGGKFDGAFSIDVIEHLAPGDESAYMENIVGSLKEDAVLIIGTPNIEAEEYASAPGASPHSNLKDHHSLRAMMNGFFVNTFIFSMNDEVLHTGFYPMAHYLWAVGAGLKD